MGGKTTDFGLVFTVKLHPRAHRDRLVGMRDGVLKVEVCAPPVDGKANRRLLQLLSKQLGIPKTSLAIHRGEKQPLKLIAAAGISPEEFQRRIHAAKILY